METSSPPSTEQQRFFLASVVDSSKASILTIDFNGLMTSWNKAAEDLHGYPGNDAIGKNLSLVVLPEDIRQLLLNIDRIKHSSAVEIWVGRFKQFPGSSRSNYKTSSDHPQ